MALTWDETDGWVFTDEYHQWQDEQAKFDHYHGSYSAWVEDYGWRNGLFSVKEDGVAPNPDFSVAAAWPEPMPKNDIRLYLVMNSVMRGLTQ